ncbi:hypothetical protein IFM89_030081 [Coptis chinensis]|uniref:Bidirectional sugar transporter SWEET n=1 Tax=Coptis chinensis TaxID=261450 RepID=A0A835M763_9MAGN|nr:hypothetical protein IFM89_030081 [Coptis chinensis]
MEDISFIVGVIGNIISVLVFLSPVDTFWRIVKHRSTEDFECLPYICTFLNSSLWTYYGTIKPGGLLVATVNGFGMVAEAIYIIIFLIFAPKKIKAKTAILAGVLDVGFLLAAVLITGFMLEGDLRIDIIGLVSAGLNIVMYGSPLAAMVRTREHSAVSSLPFTVHGLNQTSKHALSMSVVFRVEIKTKTKTGKWRREVVSKRQRRGRVVDTSVEIIYKTVVATKSVEYMPFFLSFFLFLNGGIWTFYAVLVRDPFLGIPNGTGFIFGTAQLVLYAIYRNPKPHISGLEVLEEGWQQEKLLPHQRVEHLSSHQ